MEATAYQSLKDHQDKHWWFVGRRRVLHSLLDKHLGANAHAEILEAGCGYGGNLELLSDFGKVAAFEYDRSAREFASQLSGISVRPGMLPDGLDLDDRRFDLIALLDVLEHIDEDIGSLRALARHLNGNGKIMLTVPAYQWLWSAHDEMHHHKRRYSRGLLKERISAAGLRPIDIGYFNSLLFPLAVAERAVSKMKGGSVATADAPPAAVNALLTQVFSLEEKAIGKFPFPFGLSLYAVAERA